MTGLAIRVNVFIVIVGALLLGIVAPSLLTLLYGPAFGVAAAPFRILALNAVLDPINVLAIQLLLGIGRPGLAAMLQAIGLAVFVPLVLLLVPRLGAEGAALAWLSSSVVRVAAISLAFPLVLGTSPFWPVPGRADLAAVLARLRA